VARKCGLTEETLADARRLLLRGHSFLNTARLLTAKYKKAISDDILRYWLDDAFRERKKEKCRRRNAAGRARCRRQKAK
jgi:hypothetical protein